METDTYAHDILSLSKVKFLLSTSGIIFNTCEYSNDDILVAYDLERGSQYGVMKEHDVIYVAEWSMNENRVIVADWKKRRMEVYENKVLSTIPGTHGIIDLDTNGRRWEGGVKNGKPYGYGVIYDEEGRKEYEGFMINESNTGYGIEYYSDINRVQYDGCYYNNNRFGKGTLYDRNGVIEYDGLWKNDSPYSPQFDGKAVDNHTESIVIPDKSLNKPESIILPSFLHSLKQIVIGDNCFEGVRLFELDRLSELDSVEIEENSFRIDYNCDNTCRIVNCSKLKSIQMGDWSLKDYHSFELNNLPSLQYIEIGVRCFYWAPLFSLTGLIDWLVSIHRSSSTSFCNSWQLYIQSCSFGCV